MDHTVADIAADGLVNGVADSPTDVLPDIQEHAAELVAHGLDLAAHEEDMIEATLAEPAQPVGLTITRVFSDPAISPFDEIEWAERSAVITGKRADGTFGETFRQDGVRVPEGWSQQALNITSQKYLHGDPKKGFDPTDGGRESGIDMLVNRVVSTFYGWGLKDGYFATAEDGEAFRDELAWLYLNQHASSNSPVWFNVGINQAYGVQGSADGYHWDHASGQVVSNKNSYKNPQGAACFLQSVKDDMADIMRLAKSEALLFKAGSGTGTDLSTLRSSKERLSGGGTPSGPVSFMRVYDAVAGVIKSGGRTRRSAKMQTLKVWHPDIMEFVECKAKEEKKALALGREGYSIAWDGEAYGTVAFQNANLSVRATDEFLNAVENNGDWTTRAVTTGEPIETFPAARIMDGIAEGTWLCGDPGMQYEDTIQKWHTCPNTEPINTSNPCAEFNFIDETACNLSSINLMRFLRTDGTFDVIRFRAACRTMLTTQEILVDNASYPTEKIALRSHQFRPLGLGYCGLGGLLMLMGLPYDSNEGRRLAGAITAIMHGEANLHSSRMARVVGPFEGYSTNREPMMSVMRMHQSAAYMGWLDATDADRDLWLEAKNIWEEVIESGNRHGFRNAQVTVIAPTGTIAFMMDSGESTGLEPCLALVQYKTLAGGGAIRIVNQLVARALRNLGYAEIEIESIVAYIDANDTIEGAPHLKVEHLPVFDCAFPPAKGTRSIAWQGHLKMMAAIQPMLSGSSSKTINMPECSSVEDIRDAYLMAWELGIKAVAIYRDGSKGSQPVSTKKEDTTPAGELSAAQQWEMIAEGGREASEAIGTIASLLGCWDDLPQLGVAGVIDRVRQATRDLDLARRIVAFNPEPAPAGPRRTRLPDDTKAQRHKFSIGGHEGYIHVGLFPDGSPGELFVTMAKEGSTLGGLMDSWATSISIALQYGVPLDVLVGKFTGGNFEPAGFTRNADIPMAKSLTDYIARWLGMEFIPGYREQHAPQREVDVATDATGAKAVRGLSTPSHPAGVHVDSIDLDPLKDLDFLVGHPAGVGPLPRSYPVPVPKIAPLGVPAQPMATIAWTTASAAPLCPSCGSLGVPNGRCHVCPNCGTSIGGCG